MSEIEVDIFKPGVAELKEKAQQYQGLTIAGIDDKDGYQLVYDAIQDLRKIRVAITKFGKEKREEALAFQRKVLRQEKELVSIISPVEDELKARRERVDEEKRRQERMVLLPSRRRMCEEVGLVLTDEQLLDLDEKEFANEYNEKRSEFLEAQERARREEEERKRREEELERARREAAEQAKKETEEAAERKAKEDAERIEREREEEQRLAHEAITKAEREKQEAIAKAEREKQEEIDRIRREQEEAERKRIQEEARKRAEEGARLAKEKEDRERAEKDRRYKEWAKKFEGMEGVEIRREGNTFMAFQKVGEITIR
jgi:DNA segregation ATPase FtsK/SpoIIIE-like protein